MSDWLVKHRDRITYFCLKNTKNKNYWNTIITIFQLYPGGQFYWWWKPVPYGILNPMVNWTRGRFTYDILTPGSIFHMVFWPWGQFFVIVFWTPLHFYQKRGVHNTIGRGVDIPGAGGSKYHGLRGRYTMGRGVNMPWVWGQYTMVRGVNIHFIYRIYEAEHASCFAYII
jgi:hypothetical protein